MDSETPAQTPVPAATPPAPLETPEAAKKRHLIVGLAVYCGVATVILIGLLVWRYAGVRQPGALQTGQPSQSSTVTFPDTLAGWKTYHVRQYGLTFQYPSDWETDLNQLQSQQLLLGDYVGALYKKSITQQYPTPSFPLDSLITITEIPNPQNLSLPALLDQQFKDCERQTAGKENVLGLDCTPVDVSEWQTMTIGGKSAVRGEMTVPEGLPTDDAYIQMNGRYLLFSATLYNQDFTGLSVIFDQILASVKFE